MLIPNTQSVWLTGKSKNQEQTMTILKRFAQNESGATAIEYGLIAGLISVVIIVALKTVGGNLTTKFNQISSNLT